MTTCTIQFEGRDLKLQAIISNRFSGQQFTDKATFASHEIFNKKAMGYRTISSVVDCKYNVKK